MFKLKTPYLILIGILLALCQLGLSRMESGNNSPDLKEVIFQELANSDENQAIEMDRTDPYGFSFR